MAATDRELDEAIRELYGQRSASWELARLRAVAELERLTTKLLGRDEDPDRLRVNSGRIKDRQRAADKLKRKWVVSNELPTGDEICDTLGDIVGVKVIGKTLRDLELFIDRLQTMVASPDHEFALADTPRDYIGHPKPSGYRARHEFLLVPVAVPDSGKVHRVRVEVQIKTMLQDAWGELTHEDMYKPGPGPLKPDSFHEQLANTMAGLLSEVDKLADALASQLDAKVTPESPARVGDGAQELETAVVTKTGPRFALARTLDGRQGLIPAVVVKDLVGSPTRIDVDDFITEGATLTVRRVENEEGFYLHPAVREELVAASEG